MKLPRLLPLIAIAIGGVVAVRAVGAAPGLWQGAQAWAEELPAAVAGEGGEAGAATPTAAAPSAVCALTPEQLAEQAGISKRTLERLEAGAAATQLSLFLRVLRQLDLLERLELLLPEPQPSPLALLEQQKPTRQRASRRRVAKSATAWSWGQP